MAVKSAGHFIQLIKAELKSNQRLKYFLGFVNTLGVSVTLLPFIILYAKENLFTSSDDTGTFLIFKIAGSVLTGFILFFLSSFYKYRYLLYGGAVLAFVLPLLVIVAPDPSSFPMVFLFGGVVYTAYSISMNGVLLEVSSTENRTLYTGIAGAGNLLPALFPLLGGWMIKAFGYQLFFLVYMAIILSSLFFIYKINCKK
jgi:MFS family permease